jgi:hypothetical protein
MFDAILAMLATRLKAGRKRKWQSATERNRHYYEKRKQKQ